jgi:hypothetical protein
MNLLKMWFGICSKDKKTRAKGEQEVFAVFSMGIWQGVAMDSLQFHLGPPCPTFSRLAVRLPLKWSTAVIGVAHLQGGRPAAIFYPFGHPTLYVYGSSLIEMVKNLVLEMFHHQIKGH